MVVTTCFDFSHKADVLWPLLFGSKMILPGSSPLFCFGLPKPVECRLGEGEDGGVDGTRECVSDKGVITQKITVWEPNKRLVFHMVNTNIYFKSTIPEIEDDFTLKEMDNGQTRICRVTTYKVNGWFKPIKHFLINQQ